MRTLRALRWQTTTYLTDYKSQTELTFRAVLTGGDAQEVELTIG